MVSIFPTMCEAEGQSSLWGMGKGMKPDGKGDSQWKCLCNELCGHELEVKSLTQPCDFSLSWSASSGEAGGTFPRTTAPPKAQ